ncbi:MAG TPA: phosphate signaling complex protein PhoU [Oleiagrimonas sp.]|nr:phosphate signaling complex protein PhoU [Oleiagrimonas sp.]
MPPHPEHLIKSYDDELSRLTDEIIDMGNLAAAQLDAAMDAVARLDTDKARAVIAGDDAIDAMEHAIGHDVVRLLALRAPMARDLREVFAALRIASDIERIGDYAGNIANRVQTLAESRPVAPARRLHSLASLASMAVHETLAAYRDRDVERARNAWAADDDLDAAYTSVFRELLTYMMEDPTSITACTHLLFIAKHIERIGDHATNIAESVAFAATGETLPNSNVQA